MKAESAGAVVFKKNSELLFLLLHSRANAEYWDFPKGMIESEETPQIAAQREIIEETGITCLTFHKGFEEKIHLYFKFQGETIFKSTIYFLVEATETNVILSEEHVAFAWVSYEQALPLLKFKNSQEVLK